MKKTLFIGLGILIGGALVCTTLVGAGSRMINLFGPLPQPPQLKSEEVELGKKLFFDGRLSGDGTTFCASCHIPEKAYTDGEPLSAGYPNTLYFRNTPTLINAGFKKFLYWDGRLPGNDLPTVIRDHLSEAHFMQADGRLIIERLRQVPEYEETFKKVYGGEPSYGKILNALSAFVKSLTSEEIPFDKYLNGDRKALSAGAERGLFLFKGKAGCNRCHAGPLLTDERFHRLGVPENPQIFEDPLRHITFRRFFKTLGVEGYASLRHDVGLYAITKEEKDRRLFKTPSLREVSRTSPYMHNGVFKSLEEIVSFYDKGDGSSDKDPLLKPLNLSDREKKDLVEFLGSLSGAEKVVSPPSFRDYQLRELGKN